MLTEQTLSAAIHEHFAERLPVALPNRPPDEQTGDEDLFEPLNRAHKVWYPGAADQPGIVLTGKSQSPIQNIPGGEYYHDLYYIAQLSQAGLEPALAWMGVSIHEASSVVEDEYYPENSDVVRALALTYPPAEVLRTRVNGLLRAEGNGTPRLQADLYTDQDNPTFSHATLRAALRTGRMLMATQGHMYLHDLTHVIAAYGVAEALPTPLEDLAKHLEALASLPGLVGAILCDPESDHGSLARAYWRNDAGLTDGEVLESTLASMRQRVTTTAQRLAGLTLAA